MAVCDGFLYIAGSHGKMKRPTFTFPGAVISALGAVIRNVKVGLRIFGDGHRLCDGTGWRCSVHF